MVSLNRSQNVLNLDRFKNDYDSLRGRKFQISVPALHMEKEIQEPTLDKIQKTIMELSREFPHKRIAMTYKTKDEEVVLELHPVTGAA